MLGKAGQEQRMEDTAGLFCGQRRNNSGGGKDTQKPLRQVFKLYAVG